MRKLALDATSRASLSNDSEVREVYTITKSRFLADATAAIAVTFFPAAKDPAGSAEPEARMRGG